ncbi:hypothetical protein BO221_07815 [Archangium sp. Cb G35]|uniref:GIY-YIG nuclease family protein n=1 Tax=Archangium sp. Cb G35 TaxID=1920190 RepID=UPI0009361093|nr:GIY-YIG nuclease family protein [Archangium sp. Cb G35]OJT25752.1 hypothetical protein BO221_07815 [Archangium sp. Cb G35]
MKIRIEWQKPILLFRNKQPVYTDDEIEAIDNKAGVYYFARKHGSSVEQPFYIGETLALRTRLKQHLNSVKIMDALRGYENPNTVRIAQGPRFFHYGYLSGDARDKKKRLKIVQRYLINEALSMQWLLLNKQGTAIRPTHTLSFEGNSAGRGCYPKSADVED